MSLFRTPYGVKTRQQTRKEQEQMTSRDEEKARDKLEIKSEPPLLEKKMCNTAGSLSTRTSSSSVRRRLELEAARKKAEIALLAIEAEAAAKVEAAVRKAEIQKTLINQELEAELADLDVEEKRSRVSSAERVEEWLKKSSRHSEREPAHIPQRTEIQELAIALRETISSSMRSNPRRTS
ncbi:hypothetical protein ACJJTC_010739 [Scirpophaga incertulas]